jgi:undecaprenyl-diphosphatase
MSAVTVTASTTVLVPAAAVGCLVLIVARRLRRAVFVAVALAVTLATRLLLVAAIARPRPTNRLSAASGWSFPSGHSTASATTALILVVVCLPLIRPRWGRLLLVTVVTAWAVAVGVSRVALVVHWPSDVLGAWALALAVVPLLALALVREPTPPQPVPADAC